MLLEQCNHCGRFLTRGWVEPVEHDDGGYEFWYCTQDEKHAKDFPEEYV